MQQATVDLFFALAPFVCFLAVLIAAFMGTRHEAATVPGSPSKTYACASCGRRGKREHMLPVTREGAVVWYCERCGH